MNRPSKTAIVCTACQKLRYVVDPPAAGYVCERCRRDGTTAALVPVRSRDPFYRDTRPRLTLTQARWILRRKGFLR